MRARVRAMHACFASDPSKSRGRLHPEAESPTRSAFQRDRDRIIHSGAFRKLKYKTQVFIYHEGDYYRTRLTHSLEVAQIARSVARCLALDEDLAEALALAHDLGHTPFGHAGEDALNAAMAEFGGFRHNEQTLRAVALLERRYAEFDGLNLTWETLEGLVKHNGPVLPLAAGERLPETVAWLDGQVDLALERQPGPEAQVAAIADGIAYSNHDIDDGFRAGLLKLDALRAAPLIGAAIEAVERRYPGLEPRRLIHESVRRLIDRMVTDLLAETRHRLDALAPADADAVRGAGEPVVAFAPEMAEADRALRAYLFRHMYRHDDVNRETARARRIVQDLFSAFFAGPDLLPVDWRMAAEAAESGERARLVADYIAGMTDRFALQEHRRLGLPATEIVPESKRL
ncbi:MAG: deoxyguanosinetriphosphate triphosphohydrolase [Inquilinus sp.]|nr:deoxyguanosinetriphosphate triphosphohydrolase [Inquilinus sp.]